MLGGLIGNSRGGDTPLCTDLELWGTKCFKQAPPPSWDVGEFDPLEFGLDDLDPMDFGLEISEKRDGLGRSRGGTSDMYEVANDYIYNGLSY